MKIEYGYTGSQNSSFKSITDGYCAQTKTYNVLVYRQHFGNTNLQSSYEEGQIFLLVKFFHFADNTKYNPADPDRDKLYKIREVINMIKVPLFLWH